MAKEHSLWLSLLGVGHVEAGAGGIGSDLKKFTVEPRQKIKIPSTAYLVTAR